MISPFLVAWMIPLFFGGLWLGLLARPRDIGSAILFAGLSYGIGLGLLGSVFFPWMLALGPSTKGFALALFSAAILTILLLRRKFRAETWISPDDAAPNRCLVAAALALTAIAVALFFLELNRLPHGQYDAWIFWNMRARFLFRAGDSWRQAFSWRSTHGTYPLLLPSNIVQAWNTLGRESLAVAKWIAAGYAVAILAVLSGSLAMFRGKCRAWLGAAFVLCQPFFAIHAASLYADTQLSFYLLATFVLVAIYDQKEAKTPTWLFLAGMTAGMAAWTKIEGVIFAIAIVGARTLAILVGRRLRTLWSEGLPFALGIFPWLAMYLYFRLNLPDKAPPIPGALSAAGLTLFQKISDPGRHWIILKSFLLEAWRPAFCLLGPIVLLAIYAAAFWRRQPVSWSWRCSALALTLLLLGYYGAYLLSPFDIVWHLRYSLDRLLFQAWPSMVFLVLLKNNNEPPSFQSK